MHKRFAIAIAGLLLSAGSLFAQSQPSIEIAVCLDTSGSMDGLIDSAKQKLWAVVTDMGTAKPSPKLRVALYQYGNDGLNPQTGWVQQLCPLTDDLDSVYEKLFALKTNGGTEFVARVVRDASQELKWSSDQTTLRMIIVAGNEPATQDTQVKLEEACKLAAGKGIIVNSIFCGSEQEGRSTGWADVARLADGRYSAIDQNGGTVVVNTPFDKEIADLGTKLNTTYVPYGMAGAGGANRQHLQDTNAASISPSAAAQRAAGKAQGQYSNSSWDLVDAVQREKLEVSSLKQADLPKEMQGMNAAEQAKFVQEKTDQRKAVQDQINQLNARRESYVKDEMQKRGLNENSAFDTALRNAIHDQAAGKGIQFQAK